MRPFRFDTSMLPRGSSARVSSMGVAAKAGAMASADSGARDRGRLFIKVLLETVRWRSGAGKLPGERQPAGMDVLQALQQEDGIGVLRKRIAHGGGAGIEFEQAAVAGRGGARCRHFAQGA